MALPPTIFSPRRRLAVRRRLHRMQQSPDAARYLLDDMTEDVIERLDFLRHEPKSALVIGDWTGTLAQTLDARGVEVDRADPLPVSGEQAIDEEQPLPGGGFQLVTSFGTLDTVNDLPGALLHLRAALAPGGLMIASFAGAGSLPALREIMAAADAERPAPRLHPMVDVRAGGQLLQRCGFDDPVIDSRSLSVRFGSLASLVADVRAQGQQNVLAKHGPALGKAAHARALDAFDELADEQGRVTETFEILTLSGWRR
ncbi:methyltransferase domain-containing protein [Novosphingobium sp. ZN18A2]|uniref:methyltransferase domain-containing protein n=1 Tax=Novosphingobium sp. ZN18A2 TaxID=3079861 RepID=UPI0030D24CB2